MRIVRIVLTSLCLALIAGCGGAQPSTPVATPPPAAASAAQPAAPLHVRLLAFNDFHGNLNPPTGHVPQVKGPVGGADYLAAHLKRLGAGKPDTVVVAAGDLVGASPLVSSLFHDEPTIDVMNAIGLTASALGNHELDKGIDELLRQQRGGCHPIDGCKLGPFGGAKFAYLGANVTSTKGKEPPLPGYVVRDVGGVKVGLVGMPLEDTPHSVVESGVAGLAFGDEAATANALVSEVRAKGADVLVLLVHQGGEVKNASLNACSDLSGPIVGIAEKLDKAYAAIVSGHTHQLYNCSVGGRPVTSALSFGRAITAIDLTLEPTKKTVLAAKAENFAVTHDIEPDPAVKAIVAKAAAAAAVIENRPVGRISETLASHGKSGADSPLGSVIADAQLEATKKSGAKIALMNTSGIRADIVFPRSGDEKEDGIVTHGECFAAQPFANGIVTVTIRGADLVAIFERELREGGDRSGLAVSEGLTVRYGNVNGKPGVVEMKLDGKAIDPKAMVRVTTNSFLADRDPALKAGKDRLEGPGDVEALEAYFAAHKLVSPPKTKRVTRD